MAESLEKKSTFYYDRNCDVIPPLYIFQKLPVDKSNIRKDNQSLSILDGSTNDAIPDTAVV